MLFRKQNSLILMVTLACCLLQFTAFSSNPVEQKLSKTLDSLIYDVNKFEEAKFILASALNKEAHSGQAFSHKIYMKQVTIEILLKDFPEAHRLLDEIEKRPSLYSKAKSQIAWNRALIHSHSGREDLAILGYKKLISELEKEEDGDLLQLSKAYNCLASSMFSLDMDLAETYYKKAIAVAQEANTFSYAAYNNLVDYYIENLNYKSASAYLDSLMYRAVGDENESNINSAKMKKSYLFSLTGHGNEALQLLKESQASNLMLGREPITSDSIYYSYVYFANNQIDSAILCALPVVESALERNENILARRSMMHLAKLYTLANMPEKAVHIYERYHLFLNTSNKMKQIENIATYNFSNSTAVSNENNPSPFKLLMGLLLSSGLFAFFFLKKRKQKELREEVVLKNDFVPLVDKEKQINKELLVKAKIALQQHSDFLSALKTDIRSLGRNKGKLDQNLNALIYKINKSMEFQSQWKEINMLFSETFPDFVLNLKRNYPTLTESELRHCMFIKLNLTIEEIAQILNIELASVRSARYRLKKKVDFSKIENLEASNP